MRKSSSVLATVDMTALLGSRAVHPSAGCCGAVDSGAPSPGIGEPPPIAGPGWGMSADAPLGAAGCRPLVTVRRQSAAVTRGTGRTAGTYVATRPRPVRRCTRGDAWLGGPVRNGEYGLGVDVGDGAVSAAVCGPDDGAVPLRLGAGPVAAAIGEDGWVALVPADGTAGRAPMVARVGDPVPVYAGGRVVPAAELVADAVQQVRALAAEQ